MTIKDSLQERFLWADLVRFLAISLVVLIHSFSLNSSFSISNQLSIYIFTFAKSSVPLFLMLSGSLLLIKQENYLTYIKKRVNRLLRPWIIWALVLYTVTYGLTFLPLTTFLKNYLSLFSAGFTYLPMIAFLYLLIPTLRIIVKHGKISQVWYAILIWWLGTSLLPYFRNSAAFPLHVDNGLVRQSVQYGGYLLLGYVLTQIRLSKKQLGLIGIITTISIFISGKLLLQNSDLNFDYVSYSAPLIVVQSAGLFLILSQSEKLLRSTPNYLQKLLVTLSQISYGVFLSHTIIIYLIIEFKKSLQFGLLGNNLVFWLIVIISSNLLIWSLTQIKGFGRWIT